MKNIYNYFFLILLLITLVSCNQQKSERATAGDNNTSGDTNSIAQNNILALEMHDKLMNYFGKDWIERESDPDLYPEYYGGSFIDNSGTFVIAITSNSDKVKELLKEALETDNFKVEIVQYSYKEMLKVMDSIDEFLVDSSIPEDHLVLSHFAGAYPDVMENRVKVLLTEINSTIINSFKRDITNSQLIIFEQGEIPELF